MDPNTNNSMVDMLFLWIAAILGAALAGTMIWLLSDVGLTGAVFIAILLALAAGLILQGIMTRPLPAPHTMDAPAAAPTPVHQAPTESHASAAPAPEPAAVAPAATAAPVGDIKPSTPLPGEADLASRPGTWSYKTGDQATGGVDYDGDGVVEGENEGTKPTTLDAARDGGPDDLKQIKGVGPKLEDMLHRMGFYHFDQVANWTADEVAWVDANLEGFKGRVSRDDWVAQAKVLAAGGETAFSKKVEEGGVYDS